MTTTSKATRAITVEEVVPHTAEKVWRALTNRELIAKWLMDNDFTPELGAEFTMRSRPMGDWDGTVRCKITAFEPPKLLAYTWIGGSSTPGATAPKLDSTVTWTLEAVPGGTRVRLVHDGFRSPENDMGFLAMSQGWGTVIQRIAGLVSTL